VTAADVRHGLRNAWSYRKGDVLAAGLTMVALVVVTAIAGGWLGVVLTLVEVGVLGRIITVQVRGARDDRDLNAYWNNLARIVKYHDPTGWDGPETVELADWETELLAAVEADEANVVRSVN
jgi:hypothetical protein